MAISALNRKLLRDVWHMRGQALAIALVIGAGVAMFVMAVNTLMSLDLTLQTYYERYRFADVFAHLTRAPEPLAQRITEIQGVQQVETRVVKHVTLDVPGMAEPAVGKLVSISANQEEGLNKLYLRRGRHIESDRSPEVLVSEAFAEAHGLSPGEAITAVLNGRKQDLRIVGIALSPEFIYQLPEGEALPDDRRYGVIWMGRRALEAAFNMEGAFNDVCLTLLPNANESEVIDRLDTLLETHGGIGAYGRADQLSHKFISNEIKELRGTALVVPTIFLSVAAFLLNVVMNRLIETQREQIAALKAFGYSNIAVGLHYGKFVLVVTLIGTAIGAFAGAQLGRGLTVMYTNFFHFPLFIFRLDGAVMVMALGIAMGAAAFATLASVRRAVRLPPAEAMRPKPPANFKPTIMERIGLAQLLSPPARMVLRHLERQWFKSAVTCFGIGMAASVLVLGSFSLDAINHVMESQFEIAQRQDVTISLYEKDEVAVLHEISELPGVRQIEGFRAVPARISSKHLSRRIGITGIEPDGELYRLIDIERRFVPLSPGGLVVSEKLAEVLRVDLGDHVTISVLEGERPVRNLPVVGMVKDFTGIAAYMSRGALNDMMREGDVVSGAHFTVDNHRVEELYTELKNTPRVAGVTLKGGALKSFEETVAETILRMRMFNVAFACIIAFGVVYNAVRISLSERGRELGTLRVIGFTRAEVSMILLGELAFLTLIAIPLGLVMGYGLAWFVVESSFDTELFRIPLVISQQTFAFAASVVIIAAILSGLLVRRRIDRLDLVSVLKSRE